MASIASERGVGVGAAASLQRGISWTGAFWIASGVPALVLFTIGTIAATVGTASWLVWTLSISVGFIQAFSYADPSRFRWFKSTNTGETSAANENFSGRFASGVFAPTENQFSPAVGLFSPAWSLAIRT